MGLDWREIGWHGGKAAVRRPRVRQNCWLASNPRMTIIRALSSLTRKKDQRELPSKVRIACSQSLLSEIEHLIAHSSGKTI